LIDCQILSSLLLLQSALIDSLTKVASSKIIRSASDPTHVIKKLSQRSSTAATFPSPSKKTEIQLEVFTADLIVICLRIFVNMSNHNTKVCKLICTESSLTSIMQLFMLNNVSGKNALDIQMLSLALLLNIFESFPQSRQFIQNIEIRHVKSIAFFFQLFFDSLPTETTTPQQSEHFQFETQIQSHLTSQSQSLGPPQILSAYLFLFLVVCSVGFPENYDQICMKFDNCELTKKDKLKQLFQSTVLDVSNVFSRFEGNNTEEAHCLMDTEMGNVVSGITQHLAFEISE
jgi:hypothetical protein